jgi:phage gp36-like protein
MTLNYTDITGFESRIPKRIMAMSTDDMPVNGGMPNTDYIIEFLASAESTVDSYLSSRYLIPIRANDGTVPSVIINACYIIAKYWLYARRNALSPEVSDQYNNIMSWLKDIQKGNADLPVLDANGNQDTNYITDIITGEEDPQIFRSSGVLF